MTDNSTPATRFAAAYALLRMAADLGDHWINAAKAVSTFLGVSLPREFRLSPSARGAVRLSRLASVVVSPRSASLRVMEVAAA